MLTRPYTLFFPTVQIRHEKFLRASNEKRLVGAYIRELRTETTLDKPSFKATFLTSVAKFNLILASLATL